MLSIRKIIQEEIKKIFEKKKKKGKNKWNDPLWKVRDHKWFQDRGYISTGWSFEESDHEEEKTQKERWGDAKRRVYAQGLSMHDKYSHGSKAPPMRASKESALGTIDPTVMEDMKSSDDLALFSYENSLFVLYKTEGIESKLKDYDIEGIENHIVAVIDTRPNDEFDAFEVHSVWAQKGYGPLIYLVAMEKSGALVPVREKHQISQDAKKIWKNFYDGKGSQYVDYSELEDNAHEEEYLNQRYTLKESPFNITQMEKKNDEALFNNPYGEMEDLLLEAAESILRNRMKDIYGEQDVSPGNEIIVYRSDNRDENKKLFGKPKFGPGVYFTSSKDTALKYGDNVKEYILKPSNIYQTPKFKKVFDYQKWIKQQIVDGGFSSKEEWNNHLQQSGYDLIQGYNPLYDSWEYVVLDKGIIYKNE